MNADLTTLPFTYQLAVKHGHLRAKHHRFLNWWTFRCAHCGMILTAYVPGADPGILAPTLNWAARHITEKHSDA